MNILLNVNTILFFIITGMAVAEYGDDPTLEAPEDDIKNKGHGHGVLNVLSQNVQVMPGHSFSCGNNTAEGRFTRENHYYRMFDTSAYTSGVEIKGVEIGIECSVTPDNTSQPLTVLIYDSDNFGEDTQLPPDNLVHESTVHVKNQYETILFIPAKGKIKSGSMIIEIFVPAGVEKQRKFCFGSNNYPQTGLSFISSSCNNPKYPKIYYPEPTSVFPKREVHWVMDVIVDIPTSKSSKKSKSSNGAKKSSKGSKGARLRWGQKLR